MITEERLNELEKENFMNGGYPEQRELIRLARLGLTYRALMVGQVRILDNENTFTNAASATGGGSLGGDPEIAAEVDLTKRGNICSN